jgi:hypothetical protein
VFGTIPDQRRSTGVPQRVREKDQGSGTRSDYGAYITAGAEFTKN